MQPLYLDYCPLLCPILFPIILCQVKLKNMFQPYQRVKNFATIFSLRLDHKERGGFPGLQQGVSPRNLGLANFRGFLIGRFFIKALGKGFLLVAPHGCIFPGQIIPFLWSFFPQNGGFRGKKHRAGFFKRGIPGPGNPKVEGRLPQIRGVFSPNILLRAPWGGSHYGEDRYAGGRYFKKPRV